MVNSTIFPCPVTFEPTDLTSQNTALGRWVHVRFAALFGPMAEHHK